MHTGAEMPGYISVYEPAVNSEAKSKWQHSIAPN